MKTYRDQFKEALACSNKAEADKWLLSEIERYYTLPDFNGGEAEAKKIILPNIGYMAGYYGRKEQEKIYELFGAEHPIFGTPEQMTEITFDAALAAGQELAK